MTTKVAAAPAAKHSAPNTAAKASVPEYNGNLQVVDIVPDWQNRHDDAGLPELAASIKAEGLLQPIVVRPCPVHPDACALILDEGAGKGSWVVLKCRRAKQNTDPIGSYILYVGDNQRDADRAAAIYRSGAGWQIIAGERRWRAHRLNKAETIRGFIHRGETDVSAAVKQTIENLGRRDLNPIQEARQMSRLADMKVPQAEIGRLFGGRSQPVVSQMIKLLAFPAEVQALFATGELTPAHGEGLGRFLPWKKACLCLAKEAMRREMDAKSMRGDIWAESDLVNNKLGVLIYTGGYSYEGRPSYTVSAEFAKKPGFFKAGWNEWIYLFPEDPKSSNLWNPEKEKQDQARAAAAKKEAAKEGSKQSKMSPAQKAERQKVIAENKQARAESTLAAPVVIEHIKSFKDYHGPSVAMLACTAIGAHWKYGRDQMVDDLAKKFEIKLPKGFVASDVESMAKLHPVDAMRLAIACLCEAESAEAMKYAHPIGDRVEQVLGEKQTKALREKAAQQLAAAATKKNAAATPPSTNPKKKGGKAK